MIQVGKQNLFGVTFDSPGLNVAFRIFDSSGAPVTAWAAMSNYDGNSYQALYTFLGTGAFSIKKVVFVDVDFTTRDTNYSEADETVQVVDVAALVLDVMISDHETIGTVGGAIATGGTNSSGSGSIVGIVQEGNNPLVGIIESSPTLGIVQEE